MNRLDVFYHQLSNSCRDQGSPFGQLTAKPVVKCLTHEENNAYFHRCHYYFFLSALCWAWLANKPPKKQEGREEAGVKRDWIRKASYPFLHGLNCVNWQKTWQIHRRVFSFTARVLISPQGLNSIVFTNSYNPSISILVTETIKSNPTLAFVGLNEISGPSDCLHLWLQSYQPPQRPPSWKLPLLPPSNPSYTQGEEQLNTSYTLWIQGGMKHRILILCLSQFTSFSSLRPHHLVTPFYCNRLNKTDSLSVFPSKIN